MVCTIRQIHESDQVKKNEMGETCGTYGTEERDIYAVLVVETEKKKPLGKPRHKWENNIKIYVK